MQSCRGMKKILVIGLLLGLGACQVGETGGSETGTGGTTNTGSQSTDDTTSDTTSYSTTEVPCTDCVSQTITWGWAGGLQQFFYESTLASCRTYTVTQTPGYGEPQGPAKTCTLELGGC